MMRTPEHKLIQVHKIPKSAEDEHSPDDLGNSFVLWDSEDRPPATDGLVYHWNGHANSDGERSVYSYCEENAERLRGKYCGWIHDLGISSVNGIRIVDHFVLENDFSYWWMTLFVEQSPWKSPSINDAIRLFALEEILLTQKPSTLRLVSGNKSLHEILSELCRNLDIHYEWERPGVKSSSRLSLRAVYAALPFAVRAIVGLARYSWTRRPLHHAPKSGWFGGDHAVFFCAYFDNMDQRAADGGLFRSNYWGGLPALLLRSGYQCNWLHLYFPCGAVPTARAAVSRGQRFNELPAERGFHSFTDAYFSAGVFLRVLIGWLKLLSISWRLGELHHAFRPQGSHFSIWPLMREDWRSSMQGPVAIENLLWAELFDKALADVPRQKRGLYLCENQAWERAFIHAWRKHGHGQLIAVPHSARSFWDIRFYRDPRALNTSLPQPDRIGVNGKAALAEFVRENQIPGSIVECEALRYDYLSRLQPSNSSDNEPRGSIRVLVLGEFTPQGTIKMLELLEAAAPLISAPITYTMKPHPNFPVVAADYPALRLKVVSDPLADILHSFDVAYSSNMTSAALDAYLAGLPVVVMLDRTRLNFSPLRGRPGVHFVSTCGELAKSITDAHLNGTVKPDRTDYFFLDPDLPRWAALLAADAQATGGA